MDEVPSVDELLQYVQLESETSIDKLAQYWAIGLDDNDSLQDQRPAKLEVIFKKWIEHGVAHGTPTTREKVINALRVIGEVNVSEFYSKEIQLQKEFSSLYKNVQEENVIVETCVMQCMPLGPPRVGKTCLKKRLLNEELQPDSVSPSTGIVEEKQTVLFTAPSMSTLQDWKPIPWEIEVLHLLQKFKRAPQILYNSIQSVSNKEGQLVTLISFSVPMAFFSIFNIFGFTQSSAQPLHPLHVFFIHMLFIAFATLSLLLAAILFVSHYYHSALGLLQLSILRKGAQKILCMEILIHFYCLFYVTNVNDDSVWKYYLVFTVAAISLVLTQEIDRRFNTTFKWIGALVTFLSNVLSFIMGIVAVPIGASLMFDQNTFQFLVAGILLLYYESSYIFGPLKILARHKFHAQRVMGLRAIMLIFIIPYTLTSSLEKYYMIEYTTLTLIGDLLVYLILFHFFSKFIQTVLKMIWVSIICAVLFHYYTSCYNIVIVHFLDLWTLIMFFSVHNTLRIIDPNDYNEASFKIVKKAAKKVPNTSFTHKLHKNQGKSFKIYFTDAGGQPEFQEVLPSLLAGPTVFFLVFDLSKGFDIKYEVNFIDKQNYTKFQSYKTEYTVMDALLQCLASISCLERFSAGKKNTEIKPRVFFIGTHKDLVKNDVVIKMENKLKSSIENTTWYKTNIIQFASDDCLILPVNNFDESDDSFNQMRKAIEKLSSSNDYKVKLPASWLGLEMALRSLEDSVISISKCQDIAKEYSSIQNKKQLDKALWFLHNRVGSIRYYKQIPELRDIVITKPQVLFTIVTNLLVGTFLDGGKAKTKFRENGCFTGDEVRKVGNIHNTGLNVNQVLALLCYLHILAPLKADHKGNREYFLPCALSHAPKPDQTELNKKGKGLVAPALLIGFKCGYTPKGVFSGLISYMLQNKHFGCEWSIDKSCLFRDQVTFVIDDTGYSLTMTYLPQYLQLEFREPQGTGGKTQDAAKKIKSNIQTSIRKGLGIVQQRLNYIYTDIKLGFYCSHNTCINDHQAHPAYLMGNNMNMLGCSNKASNTIPVNDEQSQWFTETSSTFLENLRLKTSEIMSSMARHKKLTVSALTILLLSYIFMFYGGVEFDLNAPSDYNHIKEVQLTHYRSLCEQYPRSVSCELTSMFQSLVGKYQFGPIILQLNASNPYSFEDITSVNNSLVLITSFDECNPKDCSKPMSEIKSNLLNSFDKHPLSNEVCWPLLRNFTGFEIMPDFLSPLGRWLGNDLSQLKIFSKFNSFLHLYYSVTYWYKGYDQCTHHLKHAINLDNNKHLKTQQFLNILRFVMNTKPELVPIVILKNINHALPTDNNNTAMESVILQLGEETTLDNHWLVPIIATFDEEKWFESAFEPVQNYFHYFDASQLNSKC